MRLRPQEKPKDVLKAPSPSTPVSEPPTGHTGAAHGRGGPPLRRLVAPIATGTKPGPRGYPAGPLHEGQLQPASPPASQHPLQDSNELWLVLIGVYYDVQVL